MKKSKTGEFLLLKIIIYFFGNKINQKQAMVIDFTLEKKICDWTN